ncbi:hypothetical protein [Algibacter mikhailovii]|uniref:hypothetical protein n=1 Tax=Algibacter mikhailovii TaxID=425498 RepID=UPI002494D18E|nr:hypothetical protein [Algibacter mikhailovii]
MKITKYIILFFLVPALFVAFVPGRIVLITVLSCYPLIMLIVPSILKMDKKDIDGRHYINLYIFYSLIILFRAVIDADSPQDISTMVSTGVSTFLFLPFIIYYTANTRTIYYLFSTFIKYGLILSLIILLKGEIGNMDFAHTVSPVYLLILFIPYLNKKWSTFIILLAIVSFFSDLSIRSNMINILLAFSIAFTFKFHKSILMYSSIKLLRTILILAPVVFVVLGVTEVFNIFSLGDIYGEYVIETADGETQDLIVDSRTAIYRDVIVQLQKDESFLFGLGGSGTTETSLTDSADPNFADIYKEGRRGTESGMLNYAQWGGFVGVVIYFLLFIKASYFGVYKSNNWLCVMIGLWVAFKVLFSFIEDRLGFNIHTLFIFVPMGMCFNRQLRAMNDNQIKVLIRGIFEKKYIKVFITLPK